MEQLEKLIDDLKSKAAKAAQDKKQAAENEKLYLNQIKKTQKLLDELNKTS